MTRPIIKIEDVGKLYQLGYVGTGSFREDVIGWWAQVRGKPNPNLPVGMERSDSNIGYLWALREIYLEIEQGEILGIIGANGAGKSTLLKLLSRVTAPTVGTIKMKGSVGSLLEVGTGFHPELTGRENVYLNGSILGMSKQEIDQKFDEIVDFAGVETYIDTPVKRYSSGMYVRLGFAVAAHLEPDILIVDEVLAVGDAEFQKKAIGKMGDVSAQGRTILFVSHNMTSVRNLTQNCILLDEGRITKQGPTNEVVDSYIAQKIHISTRKDLQNFKYPGVDPNAPLQIKNIWVNDDKDSDQVPLIPVGDGDISVNLLVEAYKEIKNPFIELNIKNKNLEIVVRFQTSKSDGFTLYPGEQIVTCSMRDVFFYPGDYFTSVGIREAVKSKIHWEVYQDVPIFEVINIGDEIVMEFGERPSIISKDFSWDVKTKVEI